jgi:hypothetical protein
VEAAEFQNEGYGVTLATPRARLALARGEIGLVEELLADAWWLQRQTWFALPAAAARLDCLAILGAPAEVEEAGRQLGRPGSYLEPFALRALGIARGDEEMLSRARESFRALELDWYEGQTETLQRLRREAT